MTRQHFLRTGLLGATGFLATPRLRAQTQKPAPLNDEIVKEFVLKAHSDLDRVTEMLENEAGLLQVAHDWGGGDFETAIGASSHVGHRELVAYLLGKGARMNLFTAAMLGDLELVKLTLKRYPGQLKTKGPHGLSLMYHAKKGGTEAEAVVAYLESLGVSE